MTAYGNMSTALAGAKFGGNTEVVSRVAGDTIEFGMPVVAYEADSEKAYQYLLDKSVLTYSADFIASNATTVTVNGTAAATITFSDTHANMMIALSAAVDAIAGVTCSQTGRILTVTVPGSVATVSTVTVGGSTQPTSSQVLSCSAGLLGVALRTQNVGGKYLELDAVNVLREGEIWVMTADAVVANKAAYMVAATGAFTDEVSGNVATGYVFRSSTSGAALARLEAIK